LFAVLDDPNDENEVRAWLARITQAAPTELGAADQIEAASADGIAFSTIEASYSADVSLVTWRRTQPDPTAPRDDAPSHPLVRYPQRRRMDPLNEKGQAPPVDASFSPHSGDADSPDLMTS
jgi:hypothetical protein